MQDAKLYFIDEHGKPVRLDYQNEITNFDDNDDYEGEVESEEEMHGHLGPQYDKLIESLLPESRKNKQKMVNLGRWTREEHKKFLTCKLIMCYYNY